MNKISKDNKLKINNYLKLAMCIALFCLYCKSVIAANANLIYSINIDKATTERGYDILGFGGDFQVAVFPYVLNNETRIELKNRTEIALMEADGGINMTMVDDGSDAINRVSTTTKFNFRLGEDPKGWKINSDIYEFDVRDKNSYDGKKPLIITLKYGDNALLTGKTINRQKMFYFDSGRNEWVSLPSTIMYNEGSVRAIIQLPYAKIAVFEEENIPCVGSASWYKYKGCNCAASPDYPKGTKLKVTAVNSDKSVIVEVNDYGPDRSVFPERVIDLDVEAFKILAPKGAGVIDVKVEPVDEICSYAFEKARHPENPVPEISAPIAVLIDGQTGEVFYQKNSDKKTPIASITKLMTASVFLDLNLDDWDKEITYDKVDDLDGAKLYVNDGETMTIKDIFYSMLVGSANNAAKTLAKNSGIGYEDFVKAMNEKTTEWHLSNTEFKDPTGLNTGNKSTALDVAKMAREVFKNFDMLKATTIQKYSFKTINTGNAHTIKTTNRLLYDKDLYITGAKTGFLNEAGDCLVLKVKNRNNGREVIGVVLGALSSEARFEDMKKLVEWGLEN